MEKKLVFLVILIFMLVPGILPSCNSDQININTASKSELEEINHVGNATAIEIINSRPFDSLDDLINVKYIGEVTLEKIKNQSVCVETSEESGDSENEKNTEKNSSENIENEKIDYDFNDNDSTKENNKNSLEKEDNKEPEIIKLSSSKTKQDKSKNSSDPKVIKKTNSFNFQKNKSKYASYGLGIVTVLVLGLMLIKYRKNRYKNEFRE